MMQRANGNLVFPASLELNGAIFQCVVEYTDGTESHNTEQVLLVDGKGID